MNRTLNWVNAAMIAAVSLAAGSALAGTTGDAQAAATDATLPAAHSRATPRVAKANARKAEAKSTKTTAPTPGAMKKVSLSGNGAAAPMVTSGKAEGEAAAVRNSATPTGTGSVANGPASPLAAAANTAAAPAAPSPDAAAPSGTEGQEAQAPPPARAPIRFRLDDGRYQGFHQDSADELRSPDRVQAETDRLQAERRNQRQADRTP